MLFRKQIIWIGFLCLFGGLSNHGLAQESNSRFITNLTDSLLNLATDQLPIEGTNQAVLKNLEHSLNINWFFEDRLVELLKRKNIAHIYFEDQVGLWSGAVNSSLVFEYKVLKLHVTYNKQIKNLNTVRRIGEVDFFLRIIEPATDTVLLSKNFKATKEDWFHLNHANLQQTKGIQFNRDQPKPSKGNILQPILISSITGIIVYLFYALRSR